MSGIPHVPQASADSPLWPAFIVTGYSTIRLAVDLSAPPDGAPDMPCVWQTMGGATDEDPRVFIMVGDLSLGVEGCFAGFTGGVTVRCAEDRPPPPPHEALGVLGPWLEPLLWEHCRRHLAGLTALHGFPLEVPDRPTA